MACRRWWRWSPPTRSPVRLHPGGTRNHFALDLGVDRDDVVGALEALVDGGERRVDLAEVWTRLRQERLAGSIRGGGAAEGLPRSSCERSSIRCRKHSARRAVASTCAGPGRMARALLGGDHPVSTTGTGSGVRSARDPPEDRRRPTRGRGGIGSEGGSARGPNKGRVVGPRVRGRRRRSGPRRNRR